MATNMIGADHFESLGLARRFAIDAQELERAYLAKSREVHPDFFQNAGVAERDASDANAAELNEAYTTLKDPVRRAEYLLKLLGGPSASQRREMPPAFLEEVLELRVEIEEAKEEGGDRVAALTTRIADEKQKVMTAVATALDAPGEMGKTQLDEIRGQLNSVKYLDGLLRDLKE